MPAKTVMGSIIAKLGPRFKAGWNQHKGDETVERMQGNLPSGINNGVAQLVECRFGEYKSGDLKGKPHVYMAGSIVQPATFKDAEGNVWKLRGRRTSVLFPMCDTPTRERTPKFEDNLGEMTNQLRLLGLDIADADPEDVEALMAGLVEEGPCFDFVTSGGEEYEDKKTKQMKKGRVWENWGRRRDDVVPTDAVTPEDQVDESEPVGEDENGDDVMPPEPAKPVRKPLLAAARAASNGDAGTTVAQRTTTQPVAAAKPSGKPVPAKTVTPPGKTTRPAARKPEPEPEPEEQESPETEGQFDEFGGLDDLAVRAEDGDVAAAAELKEHALKAGIDEAVFEDEATTWADVAEYVKTTGVAPEDNPATGRSTVDDVGQQPEDEDQTPEDAAEDETQEPELVAPRKKQPVLYAPPDPKRKGKTLKAIKCTVVIVDEASQTVDLKSLVDGKTVWKNVSWDQVTPA